ncbi:MAG: response regulator [bacterium]|nr:response regulator [bacterium]
MPTVLIVDDSEMDRRLIGGILEKRSNWQVQTAENGTQALQRLEQGGIDVVVTDMQMPEMDGLHLVQAIRLRFGETPVVLMTGQGSETLAVEALQGGAASYVPKSQAAVMLPETVEQLEAVVSADRTYGRLVDCIKRNELSLELTNDPSLIDPLVDLVQQMVHGVGVVDTIDRVRLGVALEQALLNALYRGNLEISSDDMDQVREKMLQGEESNLVEERRNAAPYKDRRIRVEVAINPEEATFTVSDEGKGFDLAAMSGPLDTTQLELKGGRGLVLMRSFMDEVQFNEVGNEVSMTKRRSAPNG